MNYSTLLQRSVDFDDYAPILYGGYPNELERQLWLAQIQLLWDRGESNGYAHHITDRAAAEHAAAHGAHARGLRRSPGGRLHDLDHGPHLRGRGPPAGARPRPLAPSPTRGSGSKRLQLPSTRLGRGLVGHRPDADRGRRDARARRPPPLTNTPPREGARPAQRAAQRGERAGAEVRVPEGAAAGSWRSAAQSPATRGDAPGRPDARRSPASLAAQCRLCPSSCSWWGRARSARRSPPCACSLPTSARPRSCGPTRSGSCSWRSRSATGSAGAWPTASPTMRGLCLLALIAAGLLALVPVRGRPDARHGGRRARRDLGRRLPRLAARRARAGGGAGAAARRRIALRDPPGGLVGRGGGHGGRPPVRALHGRLAGGHAAVGAPVHPAGGHAPDLPHLRAGDRGGRRARAAPRAALGARARPRSRC